MFLAKITAIQAIVLALAVMATGVYAASPDSFEVDSAADTAIDQPSAGSLAAAKDIAVRQTQVHSLDVGGVFNTADRDYVKFTLAADSDVLIQTDVDVGTANTMLRLYDSVGNALGTDDNGNPANNQTSRLIATGLVAGTYYVSVEEAGLEGNLAQVVESYRLTLLTTTPGGSFSPHISSSLTVGGVLGTDFEYVFSGAGSGTISYMATGIPAGLGLSGNRIFGVPTQTGTFDVTLTASNGVAPDESKILKLNVSAFGIITTLAGNGTFAFNGDNGSAVSAALNSPSGVAIDNSGNILIADTNNSRIRMVDAVTGVITTIAGGGAVSVQDNGPATSGIVQNASDQQQVAFDAAGNVYFTDRNNNRIRKVDIATNVITTVAGNGVAGFSGDGGPATSASIRSPSGVLVDSAGNIYIADTLNHRIRKVDVTTGVISTVAGTGLVGNTGDGAAATAATFSSPHGLASDGTNLYIADTNNNRIRRMPLAGGNIINWVGSAAGTSGNGVDNVVPTGAILNRPRGIHYVGIATIGTLYIADSSNNRIRTNSSFGAQGNVFILAGGATSGNTGDGAAATAALLSNPNAVTVSGSTVLIADSGNNRIRAVPTGGGNITHFAGTAAGTAGFGGEGGAANVALLRQPRAVAASATAIYIMDDNNRVRRVAGLTATSIINTFAGGGIPGDGGVATLAVLSSPQSLALDAAGNIYFTDAGFLRVRRIDAVTKVITTIAGAGPSGFTGDNGPAVSATLSSGISGLTVSGSTLYIADAGNNAVRAVNLTSGIITTLAGTGVFDFTGDGAAATAATLAGPRDVAVAANGDIFISDSSNNCVRKVAGGIITSVAGIGESPGFSGDGGAPAAARFNFPRGLAFNAAGNLFVSDGTSNRVRLIDFTANTINTVVGKGAGFAGDGDAGIDAQLDSPRDIALNAAGELFIADSFNSRVRKVAPAMAPLITNALTASGTKNQFFQFRLTATGHPAPVFAANGLPAGLLLVNGVISGFPTAAGAFDVGLIAFNQLGNDSKTLRISIGNALPQNAAPAFTTVPVTVTASPNPAVVGGTVTFGSPTVSDTDGDALAFTWDYGDNTIGAGQTSTHTYAAPGLYTVTLTVTDGTANTTATVVVAVNKADVTEDIVIDALSVKVNFNPKAPSDQLSIAGTLPLRDGFGAAVTGKVIRAFIGPLQREYVLTAKGSNTSKIDTLKLAFKQTAGSFIDTDKRFYAGKFSIKLSKQTLQPDLAALGFVANQTVSIPLRLPLLISVDGDNYADTPTIIYKSSSKSGSGKRLDPGTSIPTR